MSHIYPILNRKVLEIERLFLWLLDIGSNKSYLRNVDEITGAKKGDNKARLCWCESERTSEKKMYFFGGRGIFSLDRPFNG